MTVIASRPATAGAQRVAAAAPPPAPVPPAIVADADRFFRTTPDHAVNVVTFNTAGDNCLHTPEGEIPDAPVFQMVTRGEAGAPIIACQETVPLLARKLSALSKNGNFRVVWPGKTWLPGWVPTSPLWNGNMLLVPKRYEVLSAQSHSFGGRLGNVWSALKGLVFGHGTKEDLVAALQDRGYEEVRLEDTTTNKRFTVIATHVAYSTPIRDQEATQLTAAVKAARARGPVVVMGDFNTPTLDTNFGHDPNVVRFWNTLAPAGLAEVGPKGKAGATDWSSGEDIDHILTSGFEAPRSEVMSGDKMAIPGRLEARQVSDHYGKAASLVISG